MQEFTRRFFQGADRASYVGDGAVGGKAEGLLRIRDMLRDELAGDAFPGVEIGIPTMAVLRTAVFDAFMERNNLWAVVAESPPDDRLALAFQKGDLPTEVVGDLRAIVQEVHQPLAVRSSSLLEDALDHPFAGVYETKMIPNNQPEPDRRFRQLVEAIKFVYASTFFSGARSYARAIGTDITREKMAVIIQEVIGRRHGDRFYPDISGVLRSYNYYPTERLKPEDGVANLALGLGKTIVDGGRSWTYCPKAPRVDPPLTDSELLKETQTRFWAVNMGRPPAYDPIRETEYLVDGTLPDAERDGVLSRLVSTFDAHSRRIYPGMREGGARILTFAPLLKLDVLPLNGIIRRLLEIGEAGTGAPVEIEFAMTLDPVRFGFLQIRPMAVSHDVVELSAEALAGDDVLVGSGNALGNGIDESIRDVVYVRPDAFEARHTRAIAGEIGAFNRRLVEAERPYLLIGFGRWGSSDPWLGIPVDWGQISGVRAIVEAGLPAMNVELSQGAHFFHNMISFHVYYLAVRHGGRYAIDWPALDALPAVDETAFVRHVRLASPLTVKVDGRSGRGVIRRRPSEETP